MNGDPCQPPRLVVIGAQAVVGRLHWEACLLASLETQGRAARNMVEALGLGPPVQLKMPRGEDNAFAREVVTANAENGKNHKNEGRQP